jgi:biotin carboxylase
MMAGTTSNKFLAAVMDVPTPSRCRSQSPEPEPELFAATRSLCLGGRRMRASSTFGGDRAAFASPKENTAVASEVVAVVDPISTGGVVALEAYCRGYSVIAVWSAEITDELKHHVPLACTDLQYTAQIDERASISETASALRRVVGSDMLVACICGGESGVTLCDHLSEELGLPSNGTAIRHRRDKKVQQELVGQSGLRAVRQAGGTQWSDVKGFVESEALPIVVKPVESAGSDGVKLCHTKEDAEAHFHLLMNAQQKVGSQGAAVLCQEFLRGKEYVVDHVSCDGEHKTVAIWVYDKRPANGSEFVYFGMLPVPSDSPEAKALIPYVRGVLDALQIKYGATHGEVMMTESGPCLVEMNCRAHGGDGAWVPLAKALNGGYSQVDATIDSFLDVASFNNLPDVPPAPFQAAGQEVMVVSYTEGTVKSTPGYEVIRRLPSFVSLETGYGPGSRVERSVDLFTLVGSAILMHQDAEVLSRDIQTIRQLENECTIFEFEPVC